MRLALISLLMIPLVVGCGGGDEEKLDAGGGGDWEEDGIGSDETCEDSLQITGQFRMADTALVINEALGEGLEFSTIHKIDIDRHEAGCISDIALQIAHGGLGCRLNLNFTATGDGAFDLLSFSFNADSYCPAFDDDLEGEYSTVGEVLLSVSGLPSQVEMETGIEETVCVDNIDFRFAAGGTLQLAASSIEQPFELNLNLTGDYWSDGSTAAECEDSETDADGDADDDGTPDDLDGDGYSIADGDCDDANAEVNPEAEEICDDGIDNDCDDAIDGDDSDCEADSG